MVRAREWIDARIRSPDADAVDEQRRHAHRRSPAKPSCALSITIRKAQAALVTLPALMQRVQARTRWGRPSTMARTFWRFGKVRRFVLLLSWLTLLPTSGRLPQISHFQAMTADSLRGLFLKRA